MKKRYGHIVRAFGISAVCAATVMIICGVLTVFFNENRYIGVIEGVIGLAFLFAASILGKEHRDRVSDYLQLVRADFGAATSNIMANFPVPIVIAHIDGTIGWYNEGFSEIFSNKNLFGVTVEGIFHELKWSEILKAGESFERNIVIGSKSYTITGRLVKEKTAPSGNADDKYSVYMYLFDNTEKKEIRTLYENERADVAVISVDNYDEILQRVTDIEEQSISSQIRTIIGAWGAEGQAMVKKTDRDRYFVVFEHQYLKKYIDSKFDILDKIRAVGEQIKLPVSVSIGVGTSGSILENETNARNALEMAHGRGGDQVCVKDDTQYNFYGGKSRDYEKSTRVKTRSIALALKDFIKNSDKVIFMGHYGADYDCFGAAMGLQRAARALGKQPYILDDKNSPAIAALYDEMRKVPEYEGMFIDEERALNTVTSDTLLVVLDTHRPSMLPSRLLLERLSKIVLIDHHRRSTEFIPNCSLVYHEPYASSTCEMATELMEYMNLGGSLTTEEAECLYTGILMDTKNFILKTGVRTFEAASYLRRLGLSTVEVKKMFNINKADYDHKVDIVKTAEEIAPDIAVARCYERFDNIKVIASQAADEMLNINNIRASFVVYPLDNGAGVSARSLGGVNVQLIMEALGGGGHMTVAGAQIKDTEIDAAVDMVKRAAINYLKENKTD